MDFWTKLNTLTAFIIEEDKTNYSKAMNHFGDNFNIFEISAVELWKLYTDDLSRAMDEHAKNKLCSTTDYMNLQVIQNENCSLSNETAKFSKIIFIYHNNVVGINIRV